MDEKQASQAPLRTGTITKLEAQKRNPNRVSIFLDGAFAFGIHASLLIEFSVRKGDILSIEDQRRLQDADQAYNARQTALDYLGYRARTEHEICQKLERNGYDEKAIAHTLLTLKDGGYLDDAAYARTYVEARFNNRGFGPARLRNELRRRGIAQHHIDAALVLEEEDLLRAARRHAQKRWGHLCTETDVFRRRKKLSTYLQRRGFSYEIIQRVVEEMEQSLEEGSA